MSGYWAQGYWGRTVPSSVTIDPNIILTADVLTSVEASFDTLALSSNVDLAAPLSISITDTASSVAEVQTIALSADIIY